MPRPNGSGPASGGATAFTHQAAVTSIAGGEPTVWRMADDSDELIVTFANIVCGGQSFTDVKLGFGDDPFGLLESSATP